ncbi:methyltransferase domain-containing protein [Microbacterium sp. Mu-80]|uniref:Methyltransferase domain-containing protein n=1 Tax=Microbacterium bandirmense TaxID=3122050 RepID=A0ABU8L816_9MICO
MSEQLDAIRDAFDRRAPVYDEDLMHQAVARAAAEFAVHDGVETVLDVATGTGLALRALRAQNPRPRLIGVDISPGMLREARAILPDAEWIEADAAALPLGDATVDLVLCVTALHLIPDTAGAFAEWRRVLRPIGRVVTATFVQRAEQHFDSAPTLDRPYVRNNAPFGSVDAISETAAASGFELRRSALWEGDHDTVLLSELVPRAATPSP